MYKLRNKIYCVDNKFHIVYICGIMTIYTYLYVQIYTIKYMLMHIYV